MIRIDGSKGGGQILRTALSLSAIEGENFRIDDIRGNRSNPGLKSQHLECVRTAARLSDAKVSGAEKGSETLEFKPGDLRNESFTVNIGTAGSVTLLFDTVLPIATHFDDYFRLRAKGGTDVNWSPPFRSFDAKLRLLNDLGGEFNADLIRTGYYPKGGGEARLESRSSSLGEIELLDRGDLRRLDIYSKASEGLRSSDVADRQADGLERRIKSREPSAEVEKTVRYVESDSTGSSLVLEAVFEGSRAVFDGLGERGKSSEEVAEEVFEQFRDFLGTDAPVDVHTADQLLVLMAIVGGRMRVPEVTDHVQTNLETVRRFGFDLELRGREIVQK